MTIRQRHDSGQHIPLLSRVRRVPSTRTLQFDVHLVPFDEFAATRVVARMIALRAIVCHRIDAVPLSQLKVLQLAKRFRDERLTRMPFLTNDDRIVLMIHRSMVDRFVSEHVFGGDVHALNDMTVHEMVNANSTLKRVFETSFAAVPPTARLRAVNVIMSANHEVQDVFVTSSGSLKDPVIGWITNTTLAQHLS